jgi:hypothetical protein
VSITKVHYPSDIPRISLDKDWGAGMMDKGLNGEYSVPCRRALNIANLIINKPELLEIAWKIAQVKREDIEPDGRLAALILWLARGREVYTGKDGLIRAKATVLVKPMTKLLELIERVEKAIFKASV